MRSLIRSATSLTLQALYKTQRTSCSLSPVARLVRSYASGPRLVYHRLLLYTGVVGLSLLMTVLLFRVIPAPGYSVENARYVLTAMSQVKASIVAIVVTVSLVALQLKASAYSPLLALSPSRNPDMSLLLLLYATAIVLDLLLLRALPLTTLPRLSITKGPLSLVLRFTHDNPLLLAYWLLVACLAALYPYLRSTLRLLNPRSVTNRLLSDVWLWKRDTLGRRGARRSAEAIRRISEVALTSIAQTEVEVAEHAVKELGATVFAIVATHASHRVDECRSLVHEFAQATYKIGSRLAYRGEGTVLVRIVKHTSASLLAIARIRPELGERLFELLGKLGADAAENSMWGPLSASVRGIAENVRDHSVRRRCTPARLTSYMVAALTALERSSVSALRKWDIRALRLLTGAAVAVLEDVRLSRPAFQKLAVECTRLIAQLGLTLMTTQGGQVTEEAVEAVNAAVVVPVAGIALGARGTADRLRQTGQTCALVAASSYLWRLAIVGYRKGFKHSSELALKSLAQLHSDHADVIEEQFDTVKEELRRSGTASQVDIAACRASFLRAKVRLLPQS